MSRSRPVPSYRLHKPSGQAVVTIRTPDGDRRDVYLGDYNSVESRRQYARAIAEASAAPHATGETSAQPPTIDQVLRAFWRHAEGHYLSPEGKPTSQLAEYRQSIKAVRVLYKTEPATAFGPLALKAVRVKMVEAGLARSEVNRRVMLIRRIFRWAAGEELVPFDAYQRLTTVTGLQKDRTTAPERMPILPVDLDHVRAVLPFLGRQVGGIIEFMILTGCRPGEACRLRRCDIDTSGTVWTFKPTHHKNAHRGKGRIIAIGPKAQELLEQFPTASPNDFVWSPKKAVEEYHARRSAARQTPRYKSHMDRNADKRSKKPKRTPGERYTAESVGHAVCRAIERANAAAADGALRIPEWSANQIRHTHGTMVRRIFGLEAAQSVLGHERASTTEIYAEKNLALAVRVASHVG